MKNATIKLITPESPERQNVADFVSAQYGRRMKVHATLPDIMFAAFENDTIVATVGLEFSNSEDSVIPCEHTFAFNWQSLLFPANRINSVLYTRWAVADRHYSGKILHAATLYAMEQGRMFGWCELKLHTAKRLEELGVRLHEVSHALLRIEAIAESVRSYYESVPYPRLYQMQLSQMAHDLK